MNCWIQAVRSPLAVALRSARYLFRTASSRPRTAICGPTTARHIPGMRIITDLHRATASFRRAWRLDWVFPGRNPVIMPCPRRSPPSGLARYRNQVLADRRTCGDSLVPRSATQPNQDCWQDGHSCPSAAQDGHERPSHNGYPPLIDIGRVLVAPLLLI